jgi:hypothetical protein
MPLASFTLDLSQSGYMFARRQEQKGVASMTADRVLTVVFLAVMLSVNYFFYGVK